MNIVKISVVMLSLATMAGCSVKPSEVGVEMQPHELSSAEENMLTSINVVGVGVAVSNLNSVINGGVVVKGFDGVNPTRANVTDKMRNDIPWLLKVTGFKTKRYMVMKRYITTTTKECHYESGWMVTQGMQLCRNFIWQKNIDRDGYERSTWSEFNKGE